MKNIKLKYARGRQRWKNRARIVKNRIGSKGLSESSSLSGEKIATSPSRIVRIRKAEVPGRIFVKTPERVGLGRKIGKVIALSTY